MRSALFVDFDNVYSGLKRLDLNVAERFAQQPIEWVDWLARELELPEHALNREGRRLLVRRVYLNPQVYQRFRPAFNRAGFEIVDCPPMTSQGKTSTDIHMVLDMVELLTHETRYDEFIVFSADADFTPVLRKLRKWDRRTTVLAVGFPSAAYQASSDLLIDEELFIGQALGFDDERRAGVSPPPVVVLPIAVPPKSSAFIAPPIGMPEEARGALIAAVVTFIRERVLESPTPIALPWFASELPKRFDALNDKQWMGEGGFRNFVEALPLQPLRTNWTGGGYVSNPAKHRSDDALAALWGRAIDVLPVARQIHDAVGAPLLSPRQIKTFLDALQTELRQRPFELTETGKRVRDRCRDRGEAIARADVSWLLKGLLLSGYVFGRQIDDIPTLAEALRKNLLSMARREQLTVDSIFEEHVGRWLGCAIASITQDTTSQLP